MRQVFVKRRPGRHTGLFELDHHPGQAVHKPHQIGAAGVERTGHTELADQQKVVVGGGVPIHHLQALGFLTAVLTVWHGSRDAIFEQLVNLAVGRFQQHGRAVTGNLVDRAVDDLGRQARVQPHQRRPQPACQHHVGLGFAPQRSMSAQGFFHGRHRLPAQVGKQANGRLLHQLVFGVGVGAHAVKSPLSGRAAGTV